MADRTVFERLAETLPEKERKELLTKLTRSMNFQLSVDESIYHKQMGADEREKLIAQDLDRLSPLARFFMWLRTVLSGRNRKELLVAAKIRQLKASINRIAPGITGFETRDLSPRVADAFFRLYVLTLPVKAIYRRLMLKTREIEGAFIDLIEERIPELRVGLSDVISMDTLQELYDEKGSEPAIKREVLAKLDEFAAGLDEELFTSIENEIVPLFFLKDIVLFPYASFFQLFHITVEGLNTTERPSFKSASAMLTLEYLEKMYFGTYATLRIPHPFRLSPEMVHYVARLAGKPSEEESAPAPRGSRKRGAKPAEADDGAQTSEGEAPGEEPEGIDEESLTTSFRALYDEVRRFERDMPLAELIRYFLKDPYYKLYVYVPKLRLKEYYVAVLKVRFIAEFSSYSESLKLRSIERQIANLFENQPMVNFENYRELKNVDYSKLGLPRFSRTRSLNVLYNFVRWYYHEYVHEMVRTLNNLVLVQNRITRNKLLQHAAALEDVERKIKDFDDELGPETEQGKIFQKLRMSVANDTSHQQAFRTIVLQMDAQAATLIERGREALNGLLKVFQELLVNQGEAMRERLEAKYYMNGRLIPLSQAIEERSERINTFLTLWRQLMENEGG